jgi:hypothetical protein
MALEEKSIRYCSGTNEKLWLTTALEQLFNCLPIITLNGCTYGLTSNKCHAFERHREFLNKGNWEVYHTIYACRP